MSPNSRVVSIRDCGSPIARLATITSVIATADAPTIVRAESAHARPINLRIPVVDENAGNRAGPDFAKAACVADADGLATAVRGMTKAAAIELAIDRIRVNSIHPGVIDTPMVANMPAEWHDGVRKITPLGRLGTADEVAMLALYLASDESSYTTGAEIAIDGASTA